MILYKLKNTKTGLFSTKGYEFKKLGSFWTDLDDLKYHIRMTNVLHGQRFADDYLSTIVIIQYEMTELEQLTIEQLR